MLGQQPQVTGTVAIKEFSNGKALLLEGNSWTNLVMKFLSGTYHFLDLRDEGIWFSLNLGHFKRCLPPGNHAVQHVEGLGCIG